MEACAKKYGQKKMKGICCLNSINIIQKKMSLVQDDRKKMYSHIVHVGILIFIIALCIVNWNKLSIITIVDDEFGYWAAGAQFAGLDWKNLLGESYYYSYGYGLLLIPLYLLRLPAEVMFKAAVIGNIIFLLASFELAVYMGKCLFPRTDKRLLMAAGGVVTLLSGNIFLVHIGAPEILLYFLFWCIAVCMMNVVIRKRKRDLVGLIILTIYIYMVHNRAVGIGLAVAFFLLVLAVKEWQGSWGKILLCSVAVLGILFIGESFIREYIIQNWYQNNPNVSSNDYGGMIQRFQKIFSIQGIINFVLSICGKMFSQGAGCVLVTFLIFSQSISICWRVLKAFRDRSREENLTSVEWSILFLALCYLAAIVINAVHKNADPKELILGRIVMGRYTDYVVGPIMFLSLLRMQEKMVKKWEVILCTAVFGGCMAAVAFQSRIAAAQEMIDFNNASISFWMKKLPSGPKGVLILGIGAVIVFWVIYLIWGSVWKKREIAVKCAVLAVIGSVGACAGVNLAGTYYDIKGTKIQQHLVPVYEYLQEKGTETEIYYVNEQEGKGLKMEWLKRLRYLDPSRALHIISLEEALELNEDGNYVIMSDMTKEIIELLSQEYELSLDSGRLCIYEYVGGNAGNQP